MKFEHFDAAQSIVNQIRQIDDLLEHLRGSAVEVQIKQQAWCFMTIGTWADCKHECKEDAANFIYVLTEYYKVRRNRLIAELETL